MKNLKETIEWVGQKKKELRTLMQELPTWGALSSPVPSYEHAKTNLAQQVFNIAFCGKVNSGKSTLLNAVLGRNILPTADRPLSSRIIEIENCKSREEESCTLLMYDGSERTFSGFDALEKFAVQHDDNATEVDGVELDSILLIRLRCYMPNFPAGIRLVDTPGIAASYESHGLLSFRYLKKAHAVVYVLKSDAPVTQSDVPFLEEVIGANKNIIFVQSCAEIYDEKRVGETRERNMELLSGILGVPKSKIEYYVLAARCELVKPTGLLERSQYEVLAPVFEQFMTSWRWLLCRTAGMDALEYASLCTEHYVSTNISQMEDIAKTAQDTTAGEKICLEAAKRAREFREAWVQDGAKWKKLVENLEKAVTAVNDDVRKRLVSLEERMVERLKQITTNDEVKAFQKALPENIEAEWQAVQDACVERLNKCMMVLEWEIPSMSKSTCGRLLGNGILVPMKLKEFGFMDGLRVVLFGVALVTATAGVIIAKGISLLWSTGRKASANEKALNDAVASLRKKFKEIRENLETQLKSKRNPLSVFFKRAMALSYQSVTEQHNRLLVHAAELFRTCVCESEENERMIQEKRKLISCWSMVQDKLKKLRKEIERRRKIIIEHN